MTFKLEGRAPLASCAEGTTGVDYLVHTMGEFGVTQRVYRCARHNWVDSHATVVRRARHPPILVVPGVLA